MKRSMNSPIGQMSARHQKIKFCAVILFTLFIAGAMLSAHSTRAAGFAPIYQSAGTMSADEKELALGWNHFEAHCASCHALSGKADTPKGKAVNATDLTSQEVQAKSDDELLKIIQNGIPGTAMPGFGKTHNPTEIKHIIAFLRKLPTLTADERKRLEEAVPPEARHKHGAGEHHEDEHEHKNPEQAQETGADQHHEHSHMQEPTPANKGQKSGEQHDHSQMEHQHSETTDADHADHNMSDMNGGHAGHDMHSMMSTIIGGPFKSMQAIGSGTSLLPASGPMNMWHKMAGDWMLMAHMNAIVDFNHQGGPRGVNKAESINWFMLMAERKVGPGQLMLRAMLSAEPFTSPNGGFPTLFQTGETYKGRPIIDAQHPHDLFMEIAAAYTLPLSEQVSLNFYGGPVGEPALGPVAFMHRASASENPAAPLGHHWQDSTHISYDVLTAGVTAWRFRLESSLFHGAEPDENRKNIEAGKLDSWSGRVWFTPTRDWSMQFSYGHLVNPEKLEPGNLKRMTASVSYNRAWDDGNWASTLVWGRNHEAHGNSNAYLLESTANFLDKNYLYTRMELVDKPGLLEENIFGRRGLDEFRQVGNHLEPGDEFDRFFRVGAFTFGGVRDFIANPKLRVGAGADVTFYHVTDGLKPVYGSSPTSFHIFLRLRPGKK